MSRINDFCLRNNFRLSTNPCISPDFCLDWAMLRQQLAAGTAKRYPISQFITHQGRWELAENDDGDCAWIVDRIGQAPPLHDGFDLSHHETAYPATWPNLLILKNLAQEANPACTIFPTGRGSLRSRGLGIGARFTTLHWPAVAWAMATLNLNLTANQNSIPRELVYDVDAMLDGRLGRVAFPFIGTDIPEGHQGQSVEGMSHGAVLAILKCGFHRCGIAWGFNADHQPIGGAFDAREDRLVEGSLLASYITCDVSPELREFRMPESGCERWCASNIPADTIAAVKVRLAAFDVGPELLFRTIAQYWDALKKMKRRDGKYRAARERAFTTEIGRDYLRELSIDELPGLTTPETLAVILALCEALELELQFVAPAFGFQKNLHFPDNDELRRRVEAASSVCRHFGVSIGFHSGSGKSPENYRVCSQATGGNLEIKTSGRYTYEMGVALSRSSDANDQVLWRDWHAFCGELAAQSAFSDDPIERALAREYISRSFTSPPADLFANRERCRSRITGLPPSPNHPFWFEYNFLYILAARGSADKSALGNHGADGYRQRARFYAISDEARLRYVKNVAAYICFLAESTGMADGKLCEAAGMKLVGYRSYDDFLIDIAKCATARGP